MMYMCMHVQCFCKQIMHGCLCGEKMDSSSTTNIILNKIFNSLFGSFLHETKMSIILLVRRTLAIETEGTVPHKQENVL